MFPSPPTYTEFDATANDSGKNAVPSAAALLKDEESLPLVTDATDDVLTPRVDEAPYQVLDAQQCTILPLLLVRPCVSGTRHFRWQRRLLRVVRQL